MNTVDNNNDVVVELRKKGNYKVCCNVNSQNIEEVKSIFLNKYQIKQKRIMINFHRAYKICFERVAD